MGTKPLTKTDLIAALADSICSRRTLHLSRASIALLSNLSSIGRSEVALLHGEERASLLAALKRIAQLLSRANGHTYNSSSSGNFRHLIKTLGRSVLDGIQGASLNGKSAKNSLLGYFSTFKGHPKHETLHSRTVTCRAGWCPV